MEDRIGLLKLNLDYSYIEKYRLDLQAFKGKTSEITGYNRESVVRMAPDHKLR